MIKFLSPSFVALALAAVVAVAVAADGSSTSYHTMRDSWRAETRSDETWSLLVTPVTRLVIQHHIGGDVEFVHDPALQPWTCEIDLVPSTQLINATAAATGDQAFGASLEQDGHTITFRTYFPSALSAFSSSPGSAMPSVMLSIMLPLAVVMALTSESGSSSSAQPARTIILSAVVLSLLGVAAASGISLAVGEEPLATLRVRVGPGTVFGHVSVSTPIGKVAGYGEFWDQATCAWHESLSGLDVPSCGQCCGGRGECDVATDTCVCMDHFEPSPLDPSGCACVKGRYGEFCEHRCRCENKAICSEGVNGNGKCQCRTGFYGERCDRVCSCANGADCNDGVDGDGTCTCLPGFYGHDCGGVCACHSGAVCDDGIAGDGTCRYCQDAASAACDDGNACTVDTCDEATGCVHTPRADGQQCSDGDPCNGDETCRAGQCIGGTPMLCDDRNACTEDQCVAGVGCVYEPLADHSPCEDASVCTLAASCQAGTCIPTAQRQCDDNDACTTNQCDPMLGCVNDDIPACEAAASCVTAQDCATQACYAAACVQGACQYSPADVGCDDGLACNGVEQCVGGTCVAASGDASCFSDNPCVQAECVEPSGECVITQLADGTSCSDGNVCNGAETCAAGVCVSDNAVPDCDDGNPCTADGCSPSSGCVHVPSDVASCDDGDVCTIGDRCQAGQCIAGSAQRSCWDSNPCTRDVCHPVHGCMAIPDTSLSCDDGDPCTTGERCSSAGECVPGSPVDPVVFCGQDSSPCTDSVCSSSLGGCITLWTDGAACDDGNACTIDRCSQGACVGEPMVCDDGNPCTNDACDPASGCVYTPNAAVCNDGSACTGVDVCVDGACVPGAAVVCDDDNSCTADSCDDVDGCVYTPVRGCVVGCATNADCDVVACHDGVCIAGQCEYQLNSQRTAGCQDGNACNGVEQCDAWGVCVPADNADVDSCLPSSQCPGSASLAAAACDDNNPCTDDRCDHALGCVSVAVEGRVCDDDNACTADDRCNAAGTCVAGEAISCDDDNVCTRDECLPGSGCVFSSLDGVACDDHDPCTLGDQCGHGDCLSGPVIECDDGNPCTDDACAAGIGCVVQAFNTAPCDDQDACTTQDTCAGGVCVGTALSCDDGNPCTDDECHKAEGCKHLPATGPICDDGDACTVGDVCADGVCVSGVPRVCDDGNVCTEDSCDAATGCVYANNAAVCSDDNACTVGDRCNAGVCEPGAAAVCDDQDPCTTDVCDATQGCVSTLDPNCIRPLPATPQPLRYVTVRGQRFATLDDVDSAAATLPCDTLLRRVPQGWSLATATEEALMAIRLRPWGAWALVLADGTAWTTGASSSLVQTEALTTDTVGAYGVDFCSKRVLITQAGDADDPRVLVHSVGTVTNYVTLGQTDFATIDNAAIHGVTGCQDGWYQVPTGWQIATADHAAPALPGHTFSTLCGVFDDGTSLMTRSAGDCGANTLASHVFPTVTIAAVHACDRRVIISRASQLPDSWPAFPAEPDNVYAIDGQLYATLDDAAPGDPTPACQQHAMRLPFGWQLAHPSDPGFATAIAANSWGTWCVIDALGHGRIAGNADGAACGQGDQQLTSLTYGGATFHVPQHCDKRVLIRRTADSYSLQMRILVLSATEIASRAIASTMEGFGIPYDLKFTLSDGVETGTPVFGDSTWARSVLYNTDGSPRYYGIVMTTDTLGYTPTGLEEDYTSSLDPLQWDQLYQYVYRYNVRLVSAFAYPYISDKIDPPDNGTVAAGTVRWHDDLPDASFLYQPAAVPAEMSLPVQGIYQYHGHLLGSHSDVQPILQYGEDGAVAAVILTLSNGQAEKMVFFFDQSKYFATSAALGHVWLPWLTRGLFIGQRRILMLAQIDDLFLSTETYDPVLMQPGGYDRSVRASGQDMYHLLDRQNEWNAALAPGSNVTISMAFNANGASQDGSDDLYNACVVLVDKYVWISHTWSHLDLTCPDSDCPVYGATTYNQAYQEARRNIDWKNNYFPTPPEVWSGNGMVTPKISGLFNPASLAALWDNGIRNVVGDNSRPELRPADVHHLLVTTDDYNGLDGIEIIPRFPTRIYFDVATPEQSEAEHRAINGPGCITPGCVNYYDELVTFDDLLKIEREWVTRYLLQLRHDPYMFHQANLVNVESGHSLLSMWMNEVLSHLARYTTLPVWTLRQELLALAYKRRMRLDQCLATGTLFIENGEISSVEIFAEGLYACDVPVTGLYASGLSGTVYGPDYTVEVPVLPGLSNLVDLSSPITW